MSITLRLRDPRRMLVRGSIVLRVTGLAKNGRCPVCGSKLYFLRSLGRYYCFNCKGYV